MTMKRVWAGFLSLLFALMAFNVQFTFAKEKEITLSVMIKQLSPEIYNQWKTTLENYAKKTSGVDVRLVVVSDWQAREQKLQAMIAAGTPPDVMVTGMASFDEATRGAFLDLNQFIDAEKYDLSNFDPLGVNFHVWRGSRFGLNFAMSSDVLYYNKNLFEEAGLPCPPTSWEDDNWTWDAALKVAQKLTKDKDGDGKIDQFGIGSLGWFYYYPWYWGGRWVSDDYTRCTIDSPEAVKALQFFADLRNKYHVQPTVQQAQSFAAGNIFMAGAAAMQTGSSLSLKSFSQIRDFSYGIAAIPKGKYRVSQIFPEAFVILRDTRYPKESWNLLKYMASEEGQIAFGIKAGFLPSRKSLLPYFKDYVRGIAPQLEPQVFIDAFKYGRYMPSRFGGWMKMDSLITSELEALWLGKDTAANIVKRLVPKVNDILKVSAKP